MLPRVTFLRSNARSLQVFASFQVRYCEVRFLPFKNSVPLSILYRIPDPCFIRAGPWLHFSLIGSTKLELQHKDVTEAIIGSAFEVFKVLGHGFLEKAYQRGLQVELQNRGRKVEIEREIRVHYKQVEVGFFKADLWVDDSVIVELKVATSYASADEAQLINELKATGVKVRLLINFGRATVEFKRLVF